MSSEPCRDDKGNGEENEPWRIPMRRRSSLLSSTRIENFTNIANETQPFSDISRSLERSAHAWTMASVKIEPCVPGMGETEISSHTYTRWKNTIVATFETNPDLSEMDKWNIFMRSAGPTLVDVLDGLSLDQVDLSSEPFTDALQKLDEHFNSEQSIFLAKMNFRVAKQKPKETNLSYLARMLKLAKCCAFSASEQEAELVMSIATNTSDSDIRKHALKRGCTFQSLRDFVRSIDLARDIEARDEKKRKLPEICEVDAVSLHSDNYGREQRTFVARRPQKSMQTQRFSMATRDNTQECSRCGFKNHDSFNCPNKEKICNLCNRKGHFAVKCRTVKRKREHSPETGKPQNKIRITKQKEEPPTMTASVNQVGVDSEAEDDI